MELLLGNLAHSPPVSPVANIWLVDKLVYIGRKARGHISCQGSIQGFGMSAP